MTDERPASRPTAIGRYQLIRILGEGGMGAVYLATDPAIDRLVALKLMRTNLTAESLRERFTREARAVGRLHHPNIVTVFEFGEHGSEPFIAMEFVEGQTLANLIARGDLALTQQLAIIDGLCAGLHYAHRAGVIHRDIKPVNVMVDNEGIVKILDFGIARAAALAVTQTATRPGTVLGTLNYMSPEQLSGKPVDQRADIFAVGAVFYEMLARRQAFPGDIDSGILQLMLVSGPTPLATLRPDLDPAVVAIVNRCLEREVEHRYPDLGVMRKDLAALPRTDGAPRPAGATVMLQPGGSPSSIVPVEMRTPGPETIDALARARRAELDAEIAAAAAALEREEYTRATEAYQHVLDADPRHPGALALQAQMSVIRQARGWVADAQAELSRGALTSASALVDRALAARPGMPEGLRLRQAIDDALQRTQISGSAPTVLAPLGAAGSTPTPRPAESTIFIRPETPAPVAPLQPSAIPAPVPAKRSAVWGALGAAVIVLGTAGAFFLFRAARSNDGASPTLAPPPSSHSEPSAGSSAGPAASTPAPAPRPTSSSTATPKGPERTTAPPTTSPGPSTSAGTTAKGPPPTPAPATSTPPPAGRPTLTPPVPPAPPVTAEPPPDAGTSVSAADASSTPLTASSAGALRGREATAGTTAVVPYAMAERQCNNGNARSCTQAGLATRNGRGVARNDAAAVGFFQRACDGGDLFGCVDLGTMYENGYGAPRDEARAITLFQRGCDGNVPVGCVFLGVMYQQGRAVTRDPARALSLYVRGCDGNNLAACNDAAMLLANNVVGSRDDARVAGWLDKACGGGFLLACRNLGLLYQQGRGVPRNEIRAVDLFRRACDGRVAIACTNLGQMFEAGRGVPQSDAEAKTFFAKACDLGDVNGCRLKGGL